MFSPKASILFNGKTLETFLLRTRTRQECLLFLLFNTVLAVLRNIVRQENLIRGTKIGKEVNPILFAGGMMIYLRNPRETMIKLNKSIQ